MYYNELKKMLASVIMSTGVLISSSAYTVFELNASAANVKSQKYSGVKADCFIKDFANEWAYSFEPDLNLEAKTITPIVDFDGNIQSYSVDYYSGSEPYGYIVIENINGELVPQEFCIANGENGIRKNIVDDLSNKSNVNLKNSYVNKELYEIAPMEYGVAVTNKLKDETVFYNAAGKINQESPDFEATKYKQSTSIFIKDFSSQKYKVDNSQTIVLSKAYDTIKNYKLISQNSCLNNVQKYCCGITGAVQIIYMQGIDPYVTWASQLKTVYNRLWKDAGVKVTRTENTDYGIHYYGSCKLSSASTALVNYAKSKGYNNSSYEF